MASSMGEALCPPPVLERRSHSGFFAERDWPLVSAYIRRLLAPGATSLPPFLQGDEEYGVTDLSQGSEVGRMEYASGQGAFKRRTFGVRIGYAGESFRGYQRQSRRAGDKRSRGRARKREVLGSGKTGVGLGLVLGLGEGSSNPSYDGDGDNGDGNDVSNAGNGCDDNTNSRGFERDSDGTGPAAKQISSDDSDSDGSATDLVVTVEGCLLQALQRSVSAAGRTDGGVSAISQLLSFHTFDDICEADIVALLQAHPMCASGQIKVFQCLRMPRKYNALWSATWRRYCYLFPLGEGPHAGVDVDVPLVQALLGRLEGRALPYNAFAHRTDRGDEKCTIFRARASAFLCEADAAATAAASSESSSTRGQLLCVELVGDRFFRRHVRILVASAIRLATRPPVQSNGDDVLDLDALVKICLSGNRALAALPLPAAGLVMAGVGVDSEALRSLRDQPALSSQQRRRRRRESSSSSSTTLVD